MKRTLRDTWPTIVVESLLIVFSILLALGVNAWRDARKQAAAQAQALVNIRQEMQRNLRELERVQPYHAAAVPRFDSLLATSLPADRTVFELLPSLAAQGLNPPILQRAAWETALTTDALANLPYDDLYWLSTTYWVQSVGVERTVLQINDIVLDRATFEPVASSRPRLMQLQMITKELAAQEETLIDFYETVLDRLDGLDVPAMDSE